MKRQQRSNPWLVLALIFAFVLGVGLMVTSCLSGTAQNSAGFSGGGNVAAISITGEILAQGSSSLLSSGTYPDDVRDLIAQANGNPQIKAILIEINSPGGSPVASEEIAHAIRNASKPTVALIRDEGTSGAYWAASAADVVVASPISITGSIGVLGSQLEFSGFMQKYGIGYEQLTAGKYKDIGTPFRNMTPEERTLVLQRLNLMQDYFVAQVAQNRNMSINRTRALATGIFYTGSQAKDLGLVDYLGGEDVAIAQIKKLTGLSSVSLVPYAKKKSLWDALASAMSQQSFALGQGIGSTLTSSGQFSVKT